MGESRRQPPSLAQLASLEPQPESVPINNLVQVEGTPLYAPLRSTAGVRSRHCMARISLPRSYVRLSAGRREISSRRCVFWPGEFDLLR
jgi:biotin synthase